MIRAACFVEIWRKGLEGSYRLGISIRGYRYDMFFGADIDPGRVGVNQRQGFGNEFFCWRCFSFCA
jgi:hypothetical protein